MKKTKLLCLLLAAAMLLCMLSACNGSGGGGNGGGERVDGSWENVDFDGQEVRFAVSVNQYDEATFPAANIYTKGPDQADSNEVTKAVLARNARAVAELNVEIIYMERDLLYDKVQGDIKDIVLSNSAISPDIYNNDYYGLGRAMINGYLWNTKNPGVDANGDAYTNYFDYTADGWYEDFIKGCTFDQNKYYIFAGDYFIDMIRMAWVVLVNNTLLADNVGSLPKWCQSLDEFYTYVEVGDWTFDSLKKLAGAVHSGSATSGKTEKTDLRVGLAINHTTDWVFESSAGVGLYYLDDNFVPHAVDNIDAYQKAVNAYKSLYEGKGVYFQQEVLSSTECFMQGNFLFAVSKLGEMESAELRDVDFEKGVVPTPKLYAENAYHTVAHDQTEVGCILKSAKAFSAASALMQYLNEESGGVINAYYEKGLKYKYNDDPHSRKMMDIVRDSLDTPFSFYFGPLCHQLLYEGAGGPPYTPTLQSFDGLSGEFASWKHAYKDCLQKMIDKFASFE
ncbi:MAG: hypothetical protein IJV96_07865 [Clostridia bacterium]|nr:hypothetical protein [Clostridia bacterium]